MPTDIVPIWSFEFLQSVARYFAQQAVHAEASSSASHRGENEEFSRNSWNSRWRWWVPRRSSRSTEDGR